MRGFLSITLSQTFYGFLCTRACEARALRACKTLTPRFTDFLTDFEKKTDCFAVYERESMNGMYLKC